MKLKHVLTEGPITYRGAGGERFGAWEEPNDEGPEAPEVGNTVVMPYSTADGTEIQVKVQYSGTHQGEQYGVEIDSIQLLAVVLNGKEVDPQAAVNVLGQDEFDPSDVQTIGEWLCDYLRDEEGTKAQLSSKLRQPAQRQAAPAQASAPAAAQATPAATPTAA